MTAAEYFENLERAVRDRAALALRMETMWEPRVAPSAGSGRGSGRVDPMARYDAAMDAEPRLREEAAALDAVIREGREVIDGIGRIAGQMEALALQLHYLGLHPWFEISVELKVSMATCYRWRNAALDLVNARGLAAVREAGRKP